MIRALVAILVLTAAAVRMEAQEWINLSPTDVRATAYAFVPTKFQAAQTSWQALERSSQKGALSLPMPDGSLHDFTIEPLHNLPPGLRQRYPMIRSFTLTSTTDPSIRGKASFGPDRLHVVLRHPQGEIYIDPLSDGRYLSYFTKDHLISPHLRESYVTHEHITPSDESRFLQAQPKRSPFARSSNEVVNLSVYRLALACTGEYANKHGGTVAGALAAMNTALDRINFVMETELAIRLQLIEGNDSLIHLDAVADPYTNGNASQMALENNNYLIAKLGNAAYDVGHVFGTGCAGVAGVSGGVGIACGSLKGFGSSCEAFTSDRFYIRVVCHELGHQFGAEHTWNNCPTAPDDQFNGPTAFEPGSGTTIMSYAGTCAEQNIQEDTDPYYHVNSIEDIVAFTRGGGGDCGEVFTTDNHQPEVTIPRAGGFVIPISTPFRLHATATDRDGDVLTYSWEQYDAGVGSAAMSDIANPQGSAPIFRSQPPSSTGERYFPSLSNVIDSTFDNTEVLPTYSRPLTFRVTARDNVLGGGGTDWEQIEFSASESAGPFLVSSFNALDTIHTGDYLTVEWDVANTDAAPVNCRKVDILLSTDGGFTYTDTLVAATANDGREAVLIPARVTDQARIMVAAADNIFFDINDRDLTILEATQRTLALDLSPHDHDICLPALIELSVTSFGLGGFDGSATLRPKSIPAGATTFDSLVVQVGEAAQFTVDFSAVDATGSYALSFYALGPTGDTLVRDIAVHAISSDFSDLALVSPAQGASNLGVRPTLSWQQSSQADAYRLQISTSPAFDVDLIDVSDIVGDTYSPEEVLEESTLYYWRLQPQNLCGSGDFTQVQAFHTLNLACETFAAEDLPQNLSQSSIGTIVSTINVPSAGVISDVNLSNIAGFHESFGDLIWLLQSPDSTTNILIERECGFSNRQFELAFDDEAADEFTCGTAFNNQSFIPSNPLGVFEGLDIQGDWSLIVHDSTVGGGGMINGWTLELCGSIAPQSPEILVLDTLDVLFANEGVIQNELLAVTDDVASASELVYTVVAVPAHGSLQLGGTVLQVGAQFTQQAIDLGDLAYVHAGQDSVPDSFVFTVQDGTGGWIPPTRFPISIDRMSVSAHDFDTQIGVSVFPNPAHHEVHIVLDDPPLGRAEVTLWSMEGILLQSTRLVSDRLTVDLAPWPTGVYMMVLQTEAGQARRRVVKL